MRPGLGSAGVSPRTLTRRRSLLDLRQGQRPLEPFDLAMGGEGADMDLERSRLAASRPIANG
jgi:hypothetical protein